MIRQRLWYAGGALITSALLFLGAIWPSLFTIFALFSLPAPLLFLSGTMKPAIIGNRPRLRIYLWGCVVLAVVSWSMEIAWLASR